ncbi:ATP-binding protein [Candidatus Pacearchaeota archaeon]|nr:ATP-binding protein [Candidatus Pacearchaeota archaeon]
MTANIVFISGGPCTGKTAVINQLQKQGHEIIPEAARRIAEKKFPGKSIAEIDKRIFHDEIFRMQKDKVEFLKNTNKIVFSDRGFGDTVAYYRINLLDVPRDNFEYAKRFNYAKVFILESLKFYKKDLLRQESKEELEKIQAEIVRAYRELGYSIINVPFMSIEKRAKFILKKTK